MVVPSEPLNQRISTLSVSNILFFNQKKVQSLSFLTVSVLKSKGKRRRKKGDASRFHFSVSFLIFSLWTFERSLKVRGGHENGDEALQISLTELIIFADFLDLNSS